TNEFAKKLEILLTDPKLCQTMGRNGRRLAEQRFSWERVAQEVLDVWNPRFYVVEDNVMKRPNKVKNPRLREKDLDNKSNKDLEETAKIIGSSVVKITRDMIRH
ncbi:MAG: glycosyltransferase, partial [Ruminiclostridium sp.]